MKKKFDTTFSVVVPVFNEAGNIEKLTEEIRGTMQKMNKPFEVIFVDDGSTDDTPKVLKNIKALKVITFRTNFGQSAALNAGIKMTQGEMVITMDGDGQNDPADIPNLLAKLNEGYDAVCGWRFDRKDEFIKVFVSNVARKLRGILVEDGVHDAGCTLKVFKKRVF